MNIKVAIIVVIYNKSVEKSNTINTLLSAKLFDATIIIHNNGPENIALPNDVFQACRERNIKINLINCISNKPLSFVYNDFIEQYCCFDKLIILDDDSEITELFINSIYDEECDIQLPQIISREDGKIYYPMENGKVIVSKTILNPKVTHSIGSGLIIDRNVVTIFKENSLRLFDEHYALYGVDVSLFRRIWELSNRGISFKLKSSSYIIHSLSRTEGVESPFRRKERLIDFAITVKRYGSLRSKMSFCKKTLINLLSLKFDDIAVMYDAYIHGSHPRCREYIRDA
ncbi:glycosyltransferase family 2 protein [Klebsiella michiganensis]|uniref:glycosyltransferase family 2 protein n=1 Tax=Klebsiella michiganensis TaxID=1134687 RepID=UPI001D0D8FEC|nr:glycosyl transferase [Klebsiella michiganensis]